MNKNLVFALSLAGSILLPQMACADNDFVDESCAVIDMMPETTAYEREMGALHERAVKSVRAYLEKQREELTKAKNFTKAAELQELEAGLESVLENADNTAPSVTAKTFMDNREWFSGITGATYTVREGKMYRNNVPAGDVVAITPYILRVDARQEFWVWFADDEVFRISSDCATTSSCQPTSLKLKDKGAVKDKAASSSAGSDAQTLAQGRYRAFMQKNGAKARQDYIKALTAKMNECAKSGKIKDAAAIQAYISEISRGAGGASPAKSAPAERIAGKFVEKNGGNYTIMFKGKEFIGTSPDKKKEVRGKLVRTSPDKSVNVYVRSGYSECIFWYDGKLLRIVKADNGSNSHSRVLERAH